MNQPTEFGTGILGGPAMWWGESGRIELAVVSDFDTGDPELQLYVATEIERAELYLSRQRLDWLIDALVASRAKM